MEQATRAYIIMTEALQLGPDKGSSPCCAGDGAHSEINYAGYVAVAFVFSHGPAGTVHSYLNINDNVDALGVLAAR